MYLCRRKVVKDFRRKILRGKQVRILYSTRCCKFRKRNGNMSLSKDGKTPFREQVRKPAICALLSLREVGGYKSAVSKHFFSYSPKHLSNP